MAAGELDVPAFLSADEQACNYDQTWLGFWGGLLNWK